MTFFFLVVGLEAKRELDARLSCASGGGSSPRVVAALGGMALRGR